MSTMHTAQTTIEMPMASHSSSVSGSNRRKVFGLDTLLRKSPVYFDSLNDVVKTTSLALKAEKIASLAATRLKSTSPATTGSKVNISDMSSAGRGRGVRTSLLPSSFCSSVNNRGTNPLNSCLSVS